MANDPGVANYAGLASKIVRKAWDVIYIVNDTNGYAHASIVGLEQLGPLGRAAYV
jgi:hypothetical protein